MGVALRSLARLGKASSDKDLPTAIAKILDATVEDAEAFCSDCWKKSRDVIDADASSDFHNPSTKLLPLLARE